MVLGEPGMGKTALLDYVGEQASGCTVIRAAGFQSEMELAFAVLRSGVRENPQYPELSAGRTAAVPGDRARAVFGQTMGGLAIFGAFTIFDFNRLRRAGNQSAVPIAASIFLDIFNVFLFMLQLFGADRD